MYIDESGFNIFTRRSKGRAPLGERVRRVVAPHGRNINTTFAVSPDKSLVHHVIEQRTVTRATFQAFINELLVILAPRVPINEEVFIIFDGARPHLNIVVPPELEDRFHVVMLPPYCPFFNPIEQAYSCLEECDRTTFRASSRSSWNSLNSRNMRAEAGLNQQQWRANVLLRIGNNALQQITQQKCANWFARIHRYKRCISPSRNHSRLNHILLMWRNTLLLWEWTLLFEWLYNTIY